MRSSLIASTLLSLSLAALGCNKADQATVAPGDEADSAAAPGDEAGEAGGMEHGEPAHEHDFPAAVDHFHSTMQPLWHAEAGEARTADTCAATAELIERAEAIVAAEAPPKASDVDAWKTSAEGLVSAARALDETCTNDPGSFDASFKGLHDAFHQLVAQVGHEDPQ